MKPKTSFAVIFGFGVGAYSIYKAVRQSRALDRSARWPSVRGKILESAVKRHWWGWRRYTTFCVRYEFTVQERIEGYTPRLCGDWFWSDDQEAEFVGRYYPGQDVEVFYDPADPRMNCLDRTDRSGIKILWLVGAGCLALGFLSLGLDSLRFTD